MRVGDTVEVHLKNHEDSSMMHNVDFHAVDRSRRRRRRHEAAPGEEKGFTFKALNPGLYVYHCASPMVAQHIANGMYGLILVEPEGGLPPVDHEFYVMQGEIYTEEPFGTQGELTESYEKLMNERPEYYVFNGHVGALDRGTPLKAKVGETVRIFFGVGGPNLTSSFHVIGEIFDRAYQLGLADQRRRSPTCRPSPCRPAAPLWSSSSSRCPAATCWSTTRCRAPSAAWRATHRRRGRFQPGHLRCAA